MNESDRNKNAETSERIICKIKLPNQDPREAECYISERGLVITGEPPIVIPLHRIKVHNPGGYQSNNLEITYIDDLDKNRKLSLEMDNPQYFDLILSRAIDEAFKFLPVIQRYVGFGTRFVAYLIDTFILIFIGVVLAVLSIMMLLPEIVDWILILIMFVYSVAFWAAVGQTPGKMAMGIKIIKTDGSPIGVGRAILRYIGYIVSGIILYIGYLMIAWDGKKQGLHDKIAGTVVVKIR